MRLNELIHFPIQQKIIEHLFGARSPAGYYKNSSKKNTKVPALVEL
jgi:hypothetical protein